MPNNTNSTFQTESYTRTTYTVSRSLLQRGWWVGFLLLFLALLMVCLCLHLVIRVHFREREQQQRRRALDDKAASQRG
ncbi:hypothetical protein STCU_11623 [Strigomonas culicis]|uniref:Uncharacterized protein n=1 Tax=Strigomonas culicis TaxID=28005 RepID=S9UZN2_9TRYP|nr:hypothetical protein STCU_11623 [Strigomonas culicis]|eukprot:EPY15995.1 hypothetical protein STCU_11623 [Strigomonas culicis]